MAECPACQGDPIARLRTSGYAYLICESCGTATLEQGSNQATYERAYFSAGVDNGYYDYEADRLLHLETAGHRLNAVAGRVRDLENVIDVGAALGFGLLAAKERGLRAVGVEISEFARERLERMGFESHRDLASVSGSFDAILFGQVLEHMPDPVGALQVAHRLLRPGGALFLETWDFESRTAQRFGRRWQQISPPSVVHLFTARGLTTMLERLGFEEPVISPWRKRVSLGVYLGVIASKLPEAIGRPLMKLARATRIARIALTYRFDDLIAVTARKPG